jgi:hypothetical protein
MKRLEWPEFGLDPTPLQIAASLMFCFGFSYCRLRRARPRRADAIRGWSDCGEASAKVSVAAKTTSPRVRNRTNGSRTRLPSELELAIFTSRFVSTLYIVQDVFCCWRLAGIHVVLFICDSLTILNFYFFPVSGMRGSVRVTWYACLRGSTQSAQGKIFISIDTMMTKHSTFIYLFIPKTEF